MPTFHNSVSRISVIFVFFLLAFSFAPSANLTAQPCTASAFEIPLNGIDEDCDGLDDLFLHLPPHIYTVVGQEFEFYFRNVILSKHPNDYVFNVTTSLGGTKLADKWVFTPGATQTGQHNFTLTVSTSTGQLLKTASSIVRVSPAGAAPDMNPKKLLLWGHSFIDQGYMPYYLDSLITKGNNPTVSFHGKRGNWVDNNKTRFEAVGGSAWLLYYNTPQSPFFYNGQLNMRAYFDEVCGPNQNPDWIVIHLDVNDYLFTGALEAATMQSIDDYVDLIYSTRTAPMIAALSAAAPNTKIGISYTPMPNSRESAFINSFGANSVLSNKYRWQKIVSRLLFRNTEFFANRENENIYLLPIHLDLDDVNDYGTSDPVHPVVNVASLTERSGYREIAKSTYAWLKYIQNPSGTPPPCSITTATVSQKMCNNNGTINAPADDSFTFQLNVAASNGSGTWRTTINGQQVTGTYGIARAMGPYPISGGTLNFTILDQTIAGCSLSGTVVPPSTCSNGVPAPTTCSGNLLLNPGFEDGINPWQGAGTLVSDAAAGSNAINLCGTSFSAERQTIVGQANEAYTLRVSAKRAQTTGTKYPVVQLKFLSSAFSLIETHTVNITSNTYQEYQIVKTSPANTAYIEASIIVDSGTGCVTADAFCLTKGTTSTPTCSITAQAVNITCNNNGTATNPADDTYTFSLNITGTNASTGWRTTFNGQQVTGTYGTAHTFGPAPISGGLATLTITDNTTSTCSTTITVTPPATCSNVTPVCSITAQAVNIICNNNGTATNPADDTYNFSLNTTGTNASTGWRTTFNGQQVTGTYGTARAFGPAPISGGVATLTITDNTNTTCSTTVSVTPPATCSGTTSSACTGNLIANNPGFENGLTGWQQAGTTIVTDPASGTNAAKICGTSFVSVRQTIAAEAGKTYTFSVNGKRESTTATNWPQAQLKFMNASWSPLSLQLKEISSNSYQPVSISAAAPAGTVWVEIMVYADANTGCVTADDFCLTSGSSGGGTTPPASYCAPKSDFPWEDWISNIKVNAATKASGKTAYSDFTSTNFTVSKAAQNSVELSATYSFFTFEPHWKVWIDYNQNGIFEEPSEVVVQQKGAKVNAGVNALAMTNASFTAPVSALNGPTRMRVTMSRTGFAGPCDNPAYGEVEDYTVTIGQTLQSSAPTTIQTPQTPVSAPEYTIYPNPATDHLSIALGYEADGSKTTIRLIDMTGLFIQEHHFSQLREPIIGLDLAEVQNGIYYIQISQEAKRVVTRKLVVSRLY